MRTPSRDDEVVAKAANDLGALIRGNPLTAIQIDSWDERGAFDDKTVSYPGRPVGGSEVALPATAVNVAVGLADALDRNPRSFHNAVLVVAGRQLSVGTRALRDSYDATYRRLRTALWTTRKNRRRLRLPKGVFAKPLDWLARDTIFELALGEVPITDGIDAVIEFLGLPDDLRTFPPDPEAADYPDFATVIRWIELDGVRKEVATLNREDLDWAIGQLTTLMTFSISLARYIDLSESPLPIVSNPDPQIVSSGYHVLRTLTMGGRILSRLIAWSGKGAVEYVPAYCGPLLLVILRHLPQRARTDFQMSVDALARQLPRVLAMISLVEATNPELRRFLAFNAAERLAEAPTKLQDEVRSSARAWVDVHPQEVALLLDDRSRPVGQGDQQMT